MRFRPGIRKPSQASANAQLVYDRDLYEYIEMSWYGRRKIEIQEIPVSHPSYFTLSSMFNM